MARPGHPGLWWSLLALPLAGLGLAWLGWKRRPRAPRPNPGLALKRARARIRLTPQLAALPPILYEYLSEKLGHGASGLAVSQMGEEMVARGATPAQVQRLTDWIARAERARYSPAGDPAGAGVEEVEKLLCDVDRSLMR